MRAVGLLLFKEKEFHHDKCRKSTGDGRHAEAVITIVGYYYRKTPFQLYLKIKNLH